MTGAELALRAIGELPDSEIDIANAALQLALVDLPTGDAGAALTHLSEIARGAVEQASVVGPDDLVGQAVAIAALMGERFGYAGDSDTYDDLDNANLIRVIERRRGLPVALGVLWLHALRAAGWVGHGIDFPGHFLLSLAHRDTQVVVDVFHAGAVMDARELRGLVKQVEGPKAELRPGLLRPMSTRAVLLRLQNNIKLRRLKAGDLEGALSCTENMLHIAPDEASQWRDAAMMNERLGALKRSIQCCEAFLRLVPRGDATAELRAMLSRLRRHLS